MQGQCREKGGVCFTCLKPPAAIPSCLDPGPPPPQGAAPSCALSLHLTPLANGALSAESEKMKVCPSECMSMSFDSRADNIS